ncbi:Mediator of DNA damage checkpoint protein 1 [Tieghemiomyces parasiticus]|uniref:Mediator of DNA damage checkpoint protein 1 n=1 Tax=Tieghemiomyces parasiticus TaxID=78921 RepID=A0A9W8AGY5_9FUNG|nr:Mediator of DNA damage checkpoint protein 1 [Tieghemiomyces parasiticus]
MAAPLRARRTPGSPIGHCGPASPKFTTTAATTFLDGNPAPSDADASSGDDYGTQPRAYLCRLNPDGHCAARYPVFKGENIVGRDRGLARILLDDPLVSRKHAVIEVAQGEHFIEDVHSATGVRLGATGARLRPSPLKYQLLHDQPVQIGGLSFRYEVCSPTRFAPYRSVHHVATGRARTPEVTPRPAKHAPWPHDGQLPPTQPWGPRVAASTDPEATQRYPPPAGPLPQLFPATQLVADPWSSGGSPGSARANTTHGNEDGPEALSSPLFPVALAAALHDEDDEDGDPTQPCAPSSPPRRTDPPLAYPTAGLAPTQLVAPVDRLPTSPPGSWPDSPAPTLGMLDLRSPETPAYGRRSELPPARLVPTQPVFEQPDEKGAVTPTTDPVPPPCAPAPLLRLDDADLETSSLSSLFSDSEDDVRITHRPVAAKPTNPAPSPRHTVDTAALRRAPSITDNADFRRATQSLTRGTRPRPFHAAEALPTPTATGRPRLRTDPPGWCLAASPVRKRFRSTSRTRQRLLAHASDALTDNDGDTDSESGTVPPSTSYTNPHAGASATRLGNHQTANADEISDFTTPEEPATGRRLRDELSKVTPALTAVHEPTGAGRGRRSRGSLAVSPAIASPTQSSPGSPVVIFTGLVDSKAALAQVVLALGGRTTDDWKECTHLVTDKSRRTCKFLCALAAGRILVSEGWVHSSQQQGRFLVPQDRYVFANYLIYVTPNIVSPKRSEAIELITAARGGFIRSPPSRSQLNLYRDRNKTPVVVGCPADARTCRRLANMGCVVVTAEFLPNAIISGVADLTR